MPKIFHYEQFAAPPPQAVDYPAVVVISEWMDEPVRRFKKKRRQGEIRWAYEENPNTWPSNYNEAGMQWQTQTLKSKKKRQLPRGARAASFEPKDFAEVVVGLGTLIMVPSASIEITVPRQSTEIVDFEY